MFAANHGSREILLRQELCALEIFPLVTAPDSLSSKMPITPAFLHWFLFLDDMNLRSSTSFPNTFSLKPCQQLPRCARTHSCHLVVFSIPVYTCFLCCFFDRRTRVSCGHLDLRRLFRKSRRTPSPNTVTASHTRAPSLNILLASQTHTR